MKMNINGVEVIGQLVGSVVVVVVQWRDHIPDENDVERCVLATAKAIEHRQVADKHQTKEGLYSLLDMPAESLANMSTRLRHTLHLLRSSQRHYINWHAKPVVYIGQLVQVSESEFKKIRQVGDTTVVNLREALGAVGLRLGMNQAEIMWWKPPEER